MDTSNQVSLFLIFTLFPIFTRLFLNRLLFLRHSSLHSHHSSLHVLLIQTFYVIWSDVYVQIEMQTRCGLYTA